jgi:hypothetical protein
MYCFIHTRVDVLLSGDPSALYFRLNYVLLPSISDSRYRVLELGWMHRRCALHCLVQRAP